MESKVYWLATSDENTLYETTTWFRCVGIEDFVKKVEDTHEIVGVLFEDNNLGFVLKEKTIL